MSNLKSSQQSTTSPSRNTPLAVREITEHIVQRAVETARGPRIPPLQYRERMSKRPKKKNQQNESISDHVDDGNEKNGRDIDGNGNGNQEKLNDKTENEKVKSKMKSKNDEGGGIGETLSPQTQETQQGAPSQKMKQSKSQSKQGKQVKGGKQLKNNNKQIKNGSKQTKQGKNNSANGSTNVASGGSIVENKTNVLTSGALLGNNNNNDDRENGEQGGTGADSKKQNVKKNMFGKGFPRKYDVLCYARVRTQESLESHHITDLPEGSTVLVAEIKDRRARIIKPINGWLSVITKFGGKIIIPADRNYVLIGARIQWIDSKDKNARKGKIVDFDETSKCHTILRDDGHGGRVFKIDLNKFSFVYEDPMYNSTHGNNHNGRGSSSRGKTHTLSIDAPHFDPNRTETAKLFDETFGKDYPGIKPGKIPYLHPGAPLITTAKLGSESLLGNAHLAPQPQLEIIEQAAHSSYHSHRGHLQLAGHGHNLAHGDERYHRTTQMQMLRQAAAQNQAAAAAHATHGAHGGHGHPHHQGGLNPAGQAGMYPPMGAGAGYGQNRNVTDPYQQSGRSRGRAGHGQNGQVGHGSHSAHGGAHPGQQQNGQHTVQGHTGHGQHPSHPGHAAHSGHSGQHGGVHQQGQQGGQPGQSGYRSRQHAAAAAAAANGSRADGSSQHKAAYYQSLQGQLSHDHGGHSRSGSRTGAQPGGAGQAQPGQVSGQSRGGGSGGAGQEYGSHNRQGMTEKQLLQQKRTEDYHKRKITEIMESLPAEFLNQIKQKLESRNIRPGHPEYERYLEKAKMKQAKYIWYHKLLKQKRKEKERMNQAKQQQQQSLAAQSGVSSNQRYRSIEEIPNPYRLPSTIEELKKAAERYRQAKSMVHSLPKEYGEKYTEEQWHEYCKQHYTKKHNAVLHRIKAIREVTAQQQGQQSHQHHQQGQVTGHGQKQSGYHHSNDPSTNGTNGNVNGNGAARGTTTTIGTTSASGNGNVNGSGATGSTSGNGTSGGTSGATGGTNGNDLRRGLTSKNAGTAHDRYSKGLMVLRGLPGSGKTTLAKKLAKRSHDAKICTEDKYHWSGREDGVGEYKFQPNLVFQARDWCTTEIRRAIENGVHLVILDNHNARISMYEEHIQFAVQHGYRFRIIEFIASEEHIDKYRARSYKKFPREVYSKLLRLWEYDPRAELINPTFSEENDNGNNHQNNQNNQTSGASNQRSGNDNKKHTHGKNVSSNTNANTNNNNGNNVNGNSNNTTNSGNSKHHNSTSGNTNGNNNSNNNNNNSNNNNNNKNNNLVANGDMNNDSGKDKDALARSTKDNEMIRGQHGQHGQHQQHGTRGPLPHRGAYQQQQHQQPHQQRGYNENMHHVHPHGQHGHGHGHSRMAMQGQASGAPNAPGAPANSNGGAPAHYGRYPQQMGPPRAPDYY